MENVKKIRLDDLHKYGKYSNEMVEAIRRRDYGKALENLTKEQRNEYELMIPILYAIKNEYDTYEFYGYLGDELQKDAKPIAFEIIRTEPEAIQGTTISKEEDFIIEAASINSNVILYMDDTIKKPEVICKICESTDISEAVLKDKDIASKIIKAEIYNNNIEIVKDIIIANVNNFEFVNDEIKNDYGFVENVCRGNEEAYEYISEHTEEFGKEGLTAAKDTLIDETTQKAQDEFTERSEEIKKEIDEKIEDGKNLDELEELIKENKKMLRHKEFLRKIQAGEVDQVRAAKLMKAFCKDMDPEYKHKLEIVLNLDLSIEEREMKENAEEKNIMNESNQNELNMEDDEIEVE